MKLSALSVEELELLVLHMFSDAHGTFEPLAAIHGLVLVEKTICANAEILWAAATKRFLLPLQPLLTQQQEPNLLDLRRIVTLMRKALRCESPRFTMVSNSNTASRARCLYTFELAYNGLLVRLTNGSVLKPHPHHTLTNGSVLTGSSGPKYQLGWGVLDDLLLVPRMQMLPLPP